MRGRLRALVVAGAAAVVALTAGSVWAQSPSWPTPPPGPFLPPPSLVPASLITPVPLPGVTGAATAVLQPAFAPPLPRVSPLPSTQFVSSEPDPGRRVRVRIEYAGLSKTLQLRYRPLSAQETPKGKTAVRIVSAFQLETFDAKGAATDPELRRPWLLLVPAPPGVDPERLLLASYDSKQGRWLPLVTSYHTDTGKLSTRIMGVGAFAVIDDAGARAP